jgi:hypothetical protein
MKIIEAYIEKEKEKATQDFLGFIIAMPSIIAIIFSI